jgi:hypothetical protein
MNTEERTALARRAAACSGWRWMPRMRVVRDDGLAQTIPEPFAQPCDGREWLPDLDDPATLGCLLALVREAWGDPEAFTSPWGQGWYVAIPREHRRFYGATEAEALVAALEAASKREG